METDTILTFKIVIAFLLFSDEVEMLNNDEEIMLIVRFKEGKDLFPLILFLTQHKA
jgi:hypothetical protein